MKMRSIIAGILFAASMLLGCAVSDDGGFNFADPPYVLNVSGVVLSSEGGLPDMTVTLASYAVEDVVYASPLAKKSVQTDAEGNFSIQWHETKSNVAYALKVVDDSADGVEYNPYFMELNVFSGSPSYDQSTGTYKVSGLKIYMTQAASQ